MLNEATLLKALAEPTRLRLTAILAVRGEVCVCHLAAGVEEPDYKVSRHLGVLRAAGVVEARREGTWMYYRLVEPKTTFERELHRCLRHGLTDSRVLSDDLGRITTTVCGGCCP